MTEPRGRPTTVADYLAILRRRKWIVILPPVVAAVAAFFVSSSRPPVYHASAQVYVNRTSLVSAVTDIVDPSVFDAPRFLATLANVARSPELARRVADRIPGMTPGKVLAETDVTPSADADILTIAANDRRAGTATRLADVFSNQFTDFTKEQATQRIDAAVASLQEKLQSLEAKGQAGSTLYASLSETESKLETVGKLLAGYTSVLRPAAGAEKIQPRPKRDTAMAFLLGAVLGLGLAFLAEALDRHVRREEEVAETLQLPLLARVPKPPRQLQKANDLIMLKDPGSVNAETFRKLRTSLEFVNPDGVARMIMVTSAVAQEGKSTTIANLAVALARANRRVVLVDLDLRAPYLSRLFHVTARPGITDVAVKRATSAEAIQSISLAPVQAANQNGRRPPGSANGAARIDGVLHLLPAGTIPPSADEMLQDPRLLAVLDELESQFDTVLIDAPPLLAFGDAMVLSARVDAIVAIIRLGRVQRPILHEFGRQLETCSAKTLGYVITGVEKSDSYRYMYDGYAYEARMREKASAKERV